MKILVLGASGMLGNSIFRLLSTSHKLSVIGTLRSTDLLYCFEINQKKKIIFDIDVENKERLIKLFNEVQPDVVINCIGLVKQLPESEDPLQAISINSLFPHRLAKLCAVFGSRLIHFSTDCVYSGSKGLYVESDQPDASDLYGRSKLLGEVDYPHTITLRTSIIGHELNGARSLINWFLSQENSVCGYKNAIFSGLPTVEIASLIRDYVLPNNHLYGVYHVSSAPISKYDLLTIVSKAYCKSIDIQSDESLFINRSLDSSRFRKATGYQPASWIKLVQSMKDFG